jgi:ribosomal protein S18 acetylase RimI-like enzyme
MPRRYHSIWLVTGVRHPERPIRYVTIQTSWEDAVVTCTISWHSGARDNLRSFFELAEDSAAELDRYIADGRVLVARRGSLLVGHLQLVDTAIPGEVELKNMAVRPEDHGVGVGRALVEAAVAHSTAEGRTLMVVATATADVGNLRFYQRCGFRFSSVERDVFTPATGYPEGATIDGIPLRDRIWLSRELLRPAPGRAVD